jgi:hypothetical protein
MSLLIVRHFAELWRNSGADSSFLSWGSRWRTDCTVLLRRYSRKENDNEENDRIRDCLAESETISASATMGAGQPGFSSDPLFGSGISF